MPHLIGAGKVRIGVQEDEERNLFRIMCARGAIANNAGGGNTLCNRNESEKFRERACERETERIS